MLFCFFCFISHQYASGYYRAAPYFLAKLMADTLPLRTFGPFLFAAVTYWMTGKFFFKLLRPDRSKNVFFFVCLGLKPEFAAFIQFFVIILSVGYSAQALVLFFGSICVDRVMAQAVLSLVFILSIVSERLLYVRNVSLGIVAVLIFFVYL